jgi:hypothetical protein
MIMKKLLLVILCQLFFLNLFGQVSIDKSIILNGTNSSDKQVENLSRPDSLQEITPAIVIQENAGRFGIATGTDSLSILINSGLRFYSAGNIIYFKASANNTGPVYISVNNLPFMPLNLFGMDTLKAGQLKTDQIYCAIFSGTEFQLLSPVNNNCRAGYVEINSTYCMETNERAAVNLWQAMVICNSNNARLCRWGEWYYACQKTGTGLVAMTGGNWEWTDDAADAKIRITGKFGCTSMGAGNIGTIDVYPYRCCYSK